MTSVTIMQNEQPSKHECTWQTYINSLRKCFTACHDRQICFQFVYVEGNSLSLLETISDIIWVGGLLLITFDPTLPSVIETAKVYAKVYGLRPTPDRKLYHVAVNLQLELCMKSTCLKIFSVKEHLRRIYYIVEDAVADAVILWEMWGKIISFITRKTVCLELSWFVFVNIPWTTWIIVLNHICNIFLRCFIYHDGYSMKLVRNRETCKCKAVGLHAFITCACVNWLLVNHVGWSDGQLVLEPFCSISRIGAGHIWCQYILIAYCNSPFPGLNMLAQRPI